MSRITPAELALWQRGGLAHTLIDVRRLAARQADGIAAWQAAAAAVVALAG